MGNDIDGREMQLEMNALLLLLMSPAARRIPHLNSRTKDLGSPVLHSTSGVPAGNADGRRGCGKSFYQAWVAIDDEDTKPEIVHRISVQHYRTTNSRYSRRSKQSMSGGMKSTSHGADSRSSVEYSQQFSGTSVDSVLK